MTAARPAVAGAGAGAVAFGPMEWSDAEIDRHSRHLLLEGLEWPGVERIRAARVAVVGPVPAEAVRLVAAAGVAQVTCFAAPEAAAAARGVDPEGGVASLPLAAATAARLRGHQAVAVGPGHGARVAEAWVAAGRPPAVVVRQGPRSLAVARLAPGAGCPACLEGPEGPPPGPPLSAPLLGIAGAVAAAELLRALAAADAPPEGRLTTLAPDGTLATPPLSHRRPCAVCGLRP